MSEIKWTDAPDGIAKTGGHLIPQTMRLDSGTMPYSVEGLSDAEQSIMRNLSEVWHDRYPSNELRSGYVTAKEQFKDFGISIPGKIKQNAEAMIGWPAKAVRALADLSVFEGFALDGQPDTYGVRKMADDNMLDVVVSQLVSSCYTHGCAFMTVTTDPDDGHVVFQPRSADWSAALWDTDKRRIKAALTITSATKYGRVTGFDLWLPSRVIRCASDADGLGPFKAIRTCKTKYDGVAVVPFVYDPQLNRPFGRSRVTRSLMRLTDIGFRTIVRMEASAEFYAVPKLWFLGADSDVFHADKWSSLVSSINAVSKDEDGDVPTMQQITQASMQPHSDMLRTIALLVSAETNLPVSDLGITMDNPASAEAMAVAERKLTREADRQNRLFSRALRDAVGIGVCLKESRATPPDELDSLRVVWAPTQEISTTSRADAFSKMAGVAPAFAQSEVGWRYAGFSQQDVDSIMASIRSQNAQNVLDRLTQPQTGAAANENDDGSRADSQTGDDPTEGNALWG